MISNKDLRRATGQEDINLEIRKRKFRWIGYTLRKEDEEVPKAALLQNLQGSRKRGRPKTSWRRSITKELGRSWNELRFLAADRQKWKELRQPMFLEEQQTILYDSYVYVFGTVYCNIPT